MVSIIGSNLNAVQRVRQFVESIPPQDVEGIDLVSLRLSFPSNYPLGRYVWAEPSGLIEINMRWFTSLEAFGVRVLLGRTVIHQVGHHTARKIHDPARNEAYAQGYEGAHISRLFGKEVALLQKVKID